MIVNAFEYRRTHGPFVRSVCFLSKCLQNQSIMTVTVASIFNRSLNRGFATRRLHSLLLLACCLLTNNPLWALRVASWNVRDYALVDRRLDDTFRPAYPKPEVEKAALRRVIKDIQPDVLALQEMGGDAFLQELQADLKAEGADYPFRQCLEAADKVRQVAVLSKVPFKPVCLRADLHYKTAGGEAFPVLRGLLGIEVLSEQGALTLYVLHLKSKLETKGKPNTAERRRGEALAIRDVIIKAQPPAAAPRYVIMGDFNEATRHPPVQLFLKKGETPLAHLLPVADSRGEAWTHRYNYEDAYTRIDHILVSPALWPMVRGGKGAIADNAAVLQASDHRLIYVDLEV